MWDGFIHSIGSSDGWLGAVVVKHTLHDGSGVFIRYAHLDASSIVSLTVGQLVERGRQLGVLGNYTDHEGEDHLHLDAAHSPFEWNTWLSQNVMWVDPVPVLQNHLGKDVLSGMLELE
jgi:murein DD-endopeptidase MepM/ murein hydrolase activator NlpD